MYENQRDEEMLDDADFGQLNDPNLGDGMTDAQIIEEEKMRAEENIYNTHLDAVKEEV